MLFDYAITMLLLILFLSSALIFFLLNLRNIAEDSGKPVFLKY